jgi:ankyrin repeat protein
MDEALPPDVVDLLRDLNITVQTGNSESTLNGSLELILHVLECVNALRQVNEIIPPDQLELTGGLFVKAQNEFSAAIGRILMFIMSTKPNPNLTELLQITVGKILNLFPESAAHDSYRNGTSLLHHAVSKAFADVRLVEVIHDANPICAGNPDNEGALPLHRAVANPEISLDVVKFLISVYPAGTSSADLEGYLPLHWAVNTDRPNIPVIEELLDAYPDACNTTCNMGSLPMHWAVDRADPNMTVVFLLMKTYAKALRKGCSAGFLPIHRCVDRANPSITCMKALIKKYPKSLEQDNCDGQLPLHRSVDRCGPSLESVALLIQSYPGALDTPDVEGYVPLHIALDGEEPSLPVVKLLIESCPESATMKTQDGLLPLHYVLNCQEPSEELIDLLLSSYPEGAEALAVDLYPEDPAADPLNWSGPWKKRKWTPLTRALELGQPHIVDMIRQAIETIHGEFGEHGDRSRPMSNGSRQSKGASRPRSNHSQPSRPTSHTTEEATPLKAENIPSTGVKKPPTSTVRNAANNNYVAESGDRGGAGGARNFSPAGESPAAVPAAEGGAPVSRSIPTAVPPKQLFPAVGAAGGASSQNERNAGRKGDKDGLPEISPRAQVTQSTSDGALLKKPVDPEVEEDTPVRVPREKREKPRHRGESRDRERAEDGEGKERDKRRHRSKSRGKPEGEAGEESDKRDGKRHHHHRRHHRPHHRRREGEEEETEEERRKRRQSEGREGGGRKPSSDSAGPGRNSNSSDRDRDGIPKHTPGQSGNANGGIAMPGSDALAAQESDLAERIRKLELAERAVARKEAEAQDAARVAYLKAREAEETLERIQQNEREMEIERVEHKRSEKSESKFNSEDLDGDEDSPYDLHSKYTENRAMSHKFPPAANSSAPKFHTEGEEPHKQADNDADALLKSLEDFGMDDTPTNTALSHKFPPTGGKSYTMDGGRSNDSQ